MKNQFLNFIEKKATHDAMIATLLLSSLYLLQLVFFYGIGGRDDSYITYWPAYSLSEFGEIVNYNGDRVEQSSSLLHVLLLALFHKTSSMPIPVLGIIFSITCGLTTALLAGKLANDANITFYKWVPFVIIFVPYFSYWSSSGMETSLVALCIIFLLIRLRIFLTQPSSAKNYLYICSSITLYILARPESVFVLEAFFALLLLYSITKPANASKHTLKIIFLIGITIAIFLGLTIWRYCYFGQFFPQPVYAKTDLGHITDRLTQGLRYLEYSLNSSTLLLLILTATTTIALISKKKTFNESVIHSLFFLLAYLSFVACAGGDWMEGRRLIAPAVPVLCVLALACIFNTRNAYIIFLLFFISALIDAQQFSEKDSIGLPATRAVSYSFLAGQINSTQKNFSGSFFNATEAFNYSHLRDMLTIPALNELVTSAIQQQNRTIVIASRQMGMIPYYLATEHYKKIKFIDLRGLVTKDISGCSFIVDSKPKSSSGILITTRYYLENQTQIMNVCLFPKADIIYDTGLINNSIDETDAVLTATGYVRYYAQYSQSSNLFSQYVGSAINR